MAFGFTNMPGTHNHDDCYYTGEIIDAMMAEKVPKSFIQVNGNGYASANGDHSIAARSAVATGDLSTALGSGADASGEYSTALGSGTNASGKQSTALGYSANASGDHSVALGRYSIASSFFSTALGSSDASGYYSTALGYAAKAIGGSATALGYIANASGDSASALGYGVNASGNRSTALGYRSNASGNESTALGYEVNASGDSATALGHRANASGDSASALGSAATASGSHSTALGSGATASGSLSTAIGYYAVTANTNSIQLGDASNLSSITAKVAITVTSDERDKTDISPVESKAVDFLRKIQAIRYVWNGRSMYIPEKESRSETDNENLSKFGLCEYDHEAHAQGSKKGSRVRVGVSAQNVQKALAEVYGDSSYANLVNDNFFDFNPDDIPEGVENQLAVNYEGFIPFLIQAVRELHERLAILEKKEVS